MARRDAGEWSAYMRDYRARKRLGRPPMSQDPDPTPVVVPNTTHLACDQRIAELEAEIRWLKARETPVADVALEDLL